MIDIKLQKSTNGTYDWTFDGLDTVNVIGEEAYHSKVVHAVLLRRGELSQEPYYDTGSRLYEYRHSKNNDRMNEYIREEVCSACSSIEGVSSARCTISRDDVNNRVLISDVVLMLSDGREVTVHAI